MARLLYYSMTRLQGFTLYVLAVQTSQLLQSAGGGDGWAVVVQGGVERGDTEASGGEKRKINIGMGKRKTGNASLVFLSQRLPLFRFRPIAFPPAATSCGTANPPCGDDFCRALVVRPADAARGISSVSRSLF